MKGIALKLLLPSSSMKAKEGDLLFTHRRWPLILLGSDLSFNKSQEPVWEAR